LLFFANRSSILTAVIFVVACVIYKFNIEKHRREKHVYFGVFLPLILLLGLVLLFNMNAILSSLYNILYEAGYHSYSLLTLTRFTEDWEFGSEFSSRSVIQQEAIKFILDNDIVFGNGIGSFRSYYGRYSHNFLIDIFNSVGLIGFVLWGSLFTFSFIRIKDAD